MSAKSQIDLLAKVLLQEFGGPNQSWGAGDMAVRLLREMREAIEAAMKELDVPGEDWPANVAKAYAILGAALCE
jgi:hypothetical protein